MFSTAYVTSHKANCRAGAFSMDGSLCATGSVDASIKILDVDRMLAKSQIESMASEQKPVDGSLKASYHSNPLRSHLEV